MFITSPFEQFVIFFFDDFFLFNSILLCALLFFLFLFISFLVFSNFSSFNPFIYIFSFFYDFIYDTVDTSVGEKGIVYFPFIFFLFLFIFITNLLGLLPFSFAVTGQLSVALSLSFIVWYGIFVLAIRTLGFSFVNLFVPSGLSYAFSFFISSIEIISYTSRLFSLGLRLFANIVAGHMLLDIISIFVYKIFLDALYYVNFISFFLLGFLLVVISALVLFELFVCFIQAYVFALLSCIYLQDVFESH